MSTIESHELKYEKINNLDKNKDNEIKNEIKTLTTSSSIKSNNENEKLNENIKQKDNKKHLSFQKPFYAIIEVESYKKFNEDISETRFYYGYENKKNSITKEKKTHCVCIIF